MATTTPFAKPKNDNDKRPTPPPTPPQPNVGLPRQPPPPVRTPPALPANRLQAQKLSYPPPKQPAQCVTMSERPAAADKRSSLPPTPSPAPKPSPGGGRNRAASTGAATKSIDGRPQRQQQQSRDSSKKSSPVTRKSTNTAVLQSTGSSTGGSGSGASGWFGSKNKNIDPTIDINDQQFYHGLLPRDDIEEILKKNGDFVIRLAGDKVEKKYILSLNVKDKISHIILPQAPDGTWLSPVSGNDYSKMRRFETVVDLLCWARTTKARLTSDGGVLNAPVYRQDWQLLHEQIAIKNKLGEGAFGDVYRAIYTYNKIPVEVAVKQLKCLTSNKEQRKKFIQEAKIMRDLKHENIVKIIGLCVIQEPLMIVMEFLKGGSLLSHLRTKGSSLKMIDKVRYCLDACRGLKFCHDKQFIHRDIAARNCLMSKTAQVKIADFGLTVIQTIHRETEAEQMPIRWMAPESLKTLNYSLASDVWSFGILVWEVFTLGSEPYAGVANADVRKRIITSHYRLTPPDCCPEDVASLMLQCWKNNPQDRVTMPRAYVVLSNTFQREKKLTH